VVEVHDHGPVNFDVLVSHYCMAFQGDPSDPELESKRAEFQAMRTEFESREGRIKSQFWCDNIQAAAILTDRDRFFCAGDPFQTAADLPLARLIGHADSLARMAEELLENSPRRTSLELVHAIEANALGCMDELASKPPLLPAKSAELRRVTAAKLREDLQLAQDYVDGAIEQTARLIYLQGMLFGVLAVSTIVVGLAVAIGQIPERLAGTDFLPTTFFLGALGAVVSVMQRLTQGNLRVRLEPGVSTVRLLGFFRPFIGGILAFAVLLLVLGGLVPLTPPGDQSARAFFFAGLAFLAGFSERFAQDMIGSGKGASATSGREGNAAVPNPVLTQ